MLQYMQLRSPRSSTVQEEGLINDGRYHLPKQVHDKRSTAALEVYSFKYDNNIQMHVLRIHITLMQDTENKHCSASVDIAHI